MQPFWNTDHDMRYFFKSISSTKLRSADGAQTVFYRSSWHFQSDRRRACVNSVHRKKSVGLGSQSVPSLAQISVSLQSLKLLAATGPWFIESLTWHRNQRSSMDFVSGLQATLVSVGDRSLSFERENRELPVECPSSVAMVRVRRTQNIHSGSSTDADNLRFKGVVPT